MLRISGRLICELDIFFPFLGGASYTRKYTVVIYLIYILLFSRESSKAKEEYDGIDMENLVTLERLKQNQRQDYLKVS